MGAILGPASSDNLIIHMNIIDFIDIDRRSLNNILPRGYSAPLLMLTFITSYVTVKKAQMNFPHLQILKKKTIMARD